LDDDVLVGLLVPAFDDGTAGEAVFTAAILAFKHRAVMSHMRQLYDQSKTDARMISSMKQ